MAVTRHLLPSHGPSLRSEDVVSTHCKKGEERVCSHSTHTHMHRLNENYHQPLFTLSARSPVRLVLVPDCVCAFTGGKSEKSCEQEKGLMIVHRKCGCCQNAHPNEGRGRPVVTRREAGTPTRSQKRCIIWMAVPVTIRGRQMGQKGQTSSMARTE